MLGQESTLSAVIVVPMEFSTSPGMLSPLLQRCPFSIARVTSAELVSQLIFVDIYSEVMSKRCYNGPHTQFPLEQFMCGVNSVNRCYSVREIVGVNFACGVALPSVS